MVDTDRLKLGDLHMSVEAVCPIESISRIEWPAISGMADSAILINSQGPKQMKRNLRRSAIVLVLDSVEEVTKELAKGLACGKCLWFQAATIARLNRSCALY